MNSSLISKIEKARIYAEEPERFRLTGLSCEVSGDNSSHVAALGADGWTCDCLFFADVDTCSHVMALQRLLGGLLPEEQRAAIGAA